MRTSPAVLTIGLLATAVLVACTESSQPVSPQASASALFGRMMACVEPPPDSDIPLPLAPADQRVDLVDPVFSNPTAVTNPLFPISSLHQVIFAGFVDGEPMRTETTLLRGTQRIRLGSRVVRALTSQYVAYIDGRIDEVALDWYVQADDGAVWYLGEDVFNYEDGQVADLSGTWITCKDGPPAMIMPASPAVGDVYRPENAYPIVFEEVVVEGVGQVVDGPRGPVPGAITVEELHMDGTREDKIFAPGYGEFATGSGLNVEALALAVPTDALPGGTPADLRAILAGSRRIFGLAADANWPAVAAAFSEVEAAWSRHSLTAVPPLLEPVVQSALDDLADAVTARDDEETRAAAVALLRASLDLQLQFERREVVDDARVEMWLRQLVVDAEAEDAAGVYSDITILEWVAQRTYSRDLRSLARGLRHLRVAADRENYAQIAGRAELLIDDEEEDDDDD